MSQLISLIGSKNNKYELIEPKVADYPVLTVRSESCVIPRRTSQKKRNTSQSNNIKHIDISKSRSLSNKVE
jgi:hypothetical protein